ncbi:DUF5666 domain-containing protein [Terriglobus tenax]|uniref:DUF5666 domain-containing protein n=1 Tax=Terriglobus tenax TaxID=1111115 RepID=UPI0021E028F7|nr:DUF5666 domain-containing protein [Terriglobus tenax]
MKRLLLAVLFGLFATAAFAHNGMIHMMGTVTAIADTSLSVKGTDGKTQTVVLVATTKFTKGDKVATLRDIRVGDPIVIHATKKADQLIAAEVKVGTMGMTGDSGGMNGMKMDHPATTTPH